MQVQNDSSEQRRRAQLQGTWADLLRVNMVLVRMLRRQEAGEAMGICSRRKERRVRETLVAGLLRCAAPLAPTPPQPQPYLQHEPLAKDVGSFLGVRNMLACMSSTNHLPTLLRHYTLPLIHPTPSLDAFFPRRKIHPFQQLGRVGLGAFPISLPQEATNMPKQGASHNFTSAPGQCWSAASNTIRIHPISESHSRAKGSFAILHNYSEHHGFREREDHAFHSRL